MDLAQDERSRDDGRVGFYLMKRRGCGDKQDQAKVLCKACQGGNIDVVKELVEQHNVNPNGEYMSQYHVICCYVYEPLTKQQRLALTAFYS